MDCERTGVGEAEGEVCFVFAWEMAWGYRFTAAGLADGRKEAFQTPTHRLWLPFLPWPPTDILHVQEERFKSQYSHAEFRYADF